MSQQIICLLEECAEHLSSYVKNVGILHTTRVHVGFLNFPLIENPNIT